MSWKRKFDRLEDKFDGLEDRIEGKFKRFKKRLKKLGKGLIWLKVCSVLLGIIVGATAVFSGVIYLNKMITDGIIGSSIMLLFPEEEKEELGYNPEYEFGTGEEPPIQDGDSNIVDGGTITGLYPSDPKLRLKAEFIELANEIALVYPGITPQMVFGVAFTEDDLSLDFSGNTASIYKDLEYAKKGYGKPHEDGYFTGGSKNNTNYKTGQVKVTNGNGIGIGTFQFHTDYIGGELKTIYNSKVMNNGEATLGNPGGPTDMLDANLGFYRPHPLFIPDAMYNVMYKVHDRMYDGHQAKDKEHPTLCAKDKRWSKLPVEIQNQILFFYAADAYHGDTNASNGNPALHDLYGTFLMDIYETYGSLTFISTDSKATIRSIVVGGKDWDGVLKSPITFNGKTWTKSLMQEMDSKYNRGYVELYNKTISNGFRIGAFYGLEALNGGTYTYNLWSKEVRDALINEGKLNPDGSLPSTGGDQDKPKGLTAVQKEIIRLSLAQVGKPYVYGTDGPNTFDCSGIVSWIYRQPSVNLMKGRKTASGLREACPKYLNPSELVPGDLVFRHDGSSSSHIGVGHVLIYIGNGEVVEAYGTDNGVIKNQISKFIGKKEYTYGRLPSLQEDIDKNSEGTGGSGNTGGGNGISGGIPGVKFPTNGVGGAAMEISSQYGWRTWSGGQIHRALDISSHGANVDIFSVLDGEVVQIGNNRPPFSGYGNVVRVKTIYNGNTYVVQYNHLKSIGVSVGNKVKAGDCIGVMGGTGGNYQVHLDMEVELEKGTSWNGKVKATRPRIHPLILYGLDTSWDRDTRNKWIDTLNIKIQCTGAGYCNDPTTLRNNKQKGYRQFNCKYHRDVSNTYPE